MFNALCVLHVLFIFILNRTFNIILKIPPKRALDACRKASASSDGCVRGTSSPAISSFSSVPMVAVGRDREPNGAHGWTHGTAEDEPDNTSAGL